MTAQNLGNEDTRITTEGAELVIERVFDAPRELVWKVITDPAHIPNWWGPRDTTTRVVEMDVRPGGKWRFDHRGPDGQPAPFRGEYLEVVPPERIVQTTVFDVEGFDDQPAVDTLTLEAMGDRTKLVSRSRFPSAEALEGAVATGMAGGVVETYDRLARLISDVAVAEG